MVMVPMGMEMAEATAEVRRAAEMLEAAKVVAVWAVPPEEARVEVMVEEAAAMEVMASPLEAAATMATMAVAMMAWVMEVQASAMGVAVDSARKAQSDWRGWVAVAAALLVGRRCHE